jgi:zinc protease
VRKPILLVLALAACGGNPQPATTPAPAAGGVRIDAAARDSLRMAPTASPAAPAIDSVPPTLGAPRPLTLPPVTTRTLANGLTVHVVEQRELPIADFVLVVRAGGERDPRGKVGLATMMANLLNEGTTTRDALQIADQEAFLGVNLQTSSGWDRSLVTLHTPTAQLDSALALMADVTLRPSFPTKELDRLKKERLTSLLQQRDQPRAMASMAFNALVFGDEHPYGRPLSGTEGSTRALARTDVQRFYQTYFVPNNASLIVVGDVRADDVMQRVERMFGGWKRGTVPAVRFPQPPASATTTLYLVDKPGAPQSSVRIGTVGVARSTEDYFPLLVMNTILGGSFTSRLNQNLRETKGYTYGAGSGFDMRQVAGPFVASAEVTGAKTDSSLVEFFKELRGIRDTVPTQELGKAKRYLQLQLPAQFETTGGVASQLVPLVLYGLPLDYYNTYAQRLEAVTQADVQRVASKYVDPSKLAVVVVGDRASVEPTVKALNLGPVSVRDMTGKPIR